MQIIAKNENILEVAQLIRRSPSKIHAYRTWNWDVVINSRMAYPFNIE